MSLLIVYTCTAGATSILRVRVSLATMTGFDPCLTLYGRMLLFGNIVSLKPLYIFENDHEEIVKYSIIKMTYFSTNLYTLTIEKCFCS